MLGNFIKMPFRNYVDLLTRVYCEVKSSSIYNSLIAKLLSPYNEALFINKKPFVRTCSMMKNL